MAKYKIESTYLQFPIILETEANDEAFEEALDAEVFIKISRDKYIPTVFNWNKATSAQKKNIMISLENSFKIIGRYIDEMKEEMGSIVITLTKEASAINKIGIILFEKLGVIAKNIKASFINRQIKMRLMKSHNFLEELEKVLEIVSEL